MAKILICDDEPALLALIEEALKTTEHDCVSAKGGSSAMSFAFNEDFDLIITDVLMPEWNGYQFVKHLNPLSSVPEKNIKILVVTGYPDHELVTHIKALPNTIAVLTKPFDVQELIDIVNTSMAQLNKKVG